VIGRSGLLKVKKGILVDEEDSGEGESARPLMLLGRVKIVDEIDLSSRVMKPCKQSPMINMTHVVRGELQRKTVLLGTRARGGKLTRIFRGVEY